jgi:hypothetical protein
MRSKNLNVGSADFTSIVGRSSDELAQVAMDMINRRDRFASKAEVRLAVSQVFATLAVYAATKELAPSSRPAAPSSGSYHPLFNPGGTPGSSPVTESE